MTKLWHVVCMRQRVGEQGPEVDYDDLYILAEASAEVYRFAEFYCDQFPEGGRIADVDEMKSFKIGSDDTSPVIDFCAPHATDTSLCIWRVTIEIYPPEEHKTPYQQGIYYLVTPYRNVLQLTGIIRSLTSSSTIGYPSVSSVERLYAEEVVRLPLTLNSRWLGRMR